MDAAVAALLGALIGVFGTVVATFVQQRSQTRRERLKMAADLGLADFNFFLEQARSRGGEFMPPLSMYVAYHLEVLDALDAGKFNPATINSIEERQKRLADALPRRG